MPKKASPSNAMENRKSSKRKSNKQSQEKNSDNTMKVPMSFKSPYIIFSLSKQHEVMKSLGDGANVNEAAKQIAQMWKNMSAKERSVWEPKSSTNKDRRKSDKKENNHESSKQAPTIPTASRKKAKVDVATLLSNPPEPPLSAFSYYFQETKPIVIEKYPHMSASDIAIVIGEMWKNIAEKDREYFLNLEKIAKATYGLKLQKWNIQCEKNNIATNEIGVAIKNSDDSNDEHKAIDYSSSKGELQDSDESSVDSNEDDLRTKIGKSRSRTPPFVMSNSAFVGDKDKLIDLPSGGSYPDLHHVPNLAPFRPDLSNANGNIISSAELNHQFADLGSPNYIAGTSTGGIPIPNSTYLPLMGVPQAYPPMAATAPGAPGFVLINPSNIIQPNQMYMQYPALSPSMIPTGSAPASGEFISRQPLLAQLPLQLRRQLQNQYPGKEQSLFIFSYILKHYAL